jgi:hypothetical protein
MTPARIREELCIVPPNRRVLLRLAAGVVIGRVVAVDDAEVRLALRGGVVRLMLREVEALEVIAGDVKLGSRSGAGRGGYDDD